MTKEHPNLNTERVELFLAALESGEYRQGAGDLKAWVPDQMSYQYCALGVATKVALKNGLRGELGPEEPSVWHGTYLAPEVCHWYGFDSLNPLLTDDVEDYSGRVAQANDKGVDFWTIAQMGRARWLKEEDE